MEKGNGANPHKAEQPSATLPPLSPALPLPPPSPPLLRRSPPQGSCTEHVRLRPVPRAVSAVVLCPGPEGARSADAAAASVRHVAAFASGPVRARTRTLSLSMLGGRQMQGTSNAYSGLPGQLHAKPGDRCATRLSALHHAQRMRRRYGHSPSFYVQHLGAFRSF